MAGTENDGSYVFNWEKGSVSHFNYRLMTKDIDPSTFHREKETLRQYIRHEAIYSNPPLPEEIVEDYAAYRKADLHFRYPEENRVTALYQDRNGMIYVGLWNHVGFNVYDPRHHTWKRYAYGARNPTTITRGCGWAIRSGPTGTTAFWRTGRDGCGVPPGKPSG